MKKISEILRLEPQFESGFKKVLPYLVTRLVGIVSFIMLIWTNIYVYSKAGNTQSTKVGVSGYELLDLVKTDSFSGVCTGLFQIFFLICIIAMYIIGTLGVLKELGCMRFKSKLFDRINEWLVYVWAGLAFLVFLFTVIFIGANTTKETIYSISFVNGFKVGFGVIFNFIVSIGFAVGYFFMRRKRIIRFEGEGDYVKKVKVAAAPVAPATPKAETVAPQTKPATKAPVKPATKKPTVKK